MSNKVPSTNVLLKPLYDMLEESHGKDNAETIKIFARKYFASSPNSELARADEDYLLELIECAWEFFHTRRSSAPKIKFVHQPPGEDGTGAGTRIYLLLDDMPFVVDSVRQSLNRAGAVIRYFNNTVLHAKRAARRNKRGGNLLELAPASMPHFKSEALSCIQCAPIREEQCGAVEKEIRETLKMVSVAVKAYRPICQRAIAIKESLLEGKASNPVSAEELEESIYFIDWIINNHFTFLGYESYNFKNSKRGKIMELQEDSMLGISKFKTDINPRQPLDELPAGTVDLILRKQICNFAKSSNRSKVHRPAYYDYILVKEFDEDGEVATEHRFTGLYTSSVYYRPALDIPLVRKKVEAVLEQSGFSPNGHSYKDLLQVINVFPRDELFQITTEQLLYTALEITQIQDTRTSKLFIRKDSYGKFFSCLVYIPRDIYTTKVRLRIQDFLQERLEASEFEFNIYLSESILARLHLVLRSPEIDKVKYDLHELEKALTDLVKPWDDYFREALQKAYPYAEACGLFDKYTHCFSEAYKESYSPREAVADIQCIENVLESEELALDLAPSHGESGSELRFKIFSLGKQLMLSRVDPILENLGMNIISEKTFKLKLEDDAVVWLHDFAMFRRSDCGKFSADTADNFEEAFLAIWQGNCDDDSFNALVVTAEFHWRDIVILRAFAAYLKQIQFSYGAVFIAETLSTHQSITQSLLKYFYTLFEPGKKVAKGTPGKQRSGIMRSIDSVVNLAEDLVLRAYLELIEATLRTNFFQRDPDGNPKEYVSFKFNPRQIEAMPKPRPCYEIFVYSRGVEGVHLRGGKVARGGLRWSDRTEDYRTEILGLVKAQQVKNSVIVPVGAKGGFVVKQILPSDDRELQQKIGIDSYKTFIRGLLDLTDNIVQGQVEHPAQMKCRDDDDTYLVVAADKGTASFSDIANSIAEEYNFWLRDAFASGGSHGYDHKEMGITARGAWISVQRHFRELGVNVQEDDFTVLGIGDMSGDVFGNGMLLSRHIKLVAAFNHRNIFIDPDPDPSRSYRERERLFNKPRSTWQDYNEELISKGGGIFSRSNKSITISKEMKARFAIDRDKLTPNQLINQLLKSPVDLIWNGGIGTYVKSREESHQEVGDKANDAVRVNGRELRAKVVGEGGNLGFTQQGRVEFALHGGMLFTDFVDNSGGVDCSDHEVNIKILLNRLHLAGKLNETNRNRLLESMTEDVAGLVLDNNYSQVESIGVARLDVAERHKEYTDLITFLEARAGLDRSLEYLPTDEELDERAAKEEYLTRPELAVLTSYMKMYLKSELESVEYIDDPFLESYLFSAFPKKLGKMHSDAVTSHPLRREIIATQLGNSLVNQLGSSFVYRMMDSTSSSVSDTVRAAVISREIYGIDRYWTEIEELDYQLDAAVQTEMMSRLVRLVRRVTRWLLRNRRRFSSFEEEIAFYADGAKAFRRMLPKKLPPDYSSMFEDKRQHLVNAGAPESLALAIAESDFMFPATSFVEICADTGQSLGHIVDVYYALGERLQLNWLGKIINQLPATSYWQALARETYLDDLAWQQRALTCNIVTQDGRSGSAKTQVRDWAAEQSQTLARTNEMLNMLQTETNPDFAMFSVVLRELLTVSQTTAALTK